MVSQALLTSGADHERDTFAGCEGHQPLISHVSATMALGPRRAETGLHLSKDVLDRRFGQNCGQQPDPSSEIWEAGRPNLMALTDAFRTKHPFWTAPTPASAFGYSLSSWCSQASAAIASTLNRAWVEYCRASNLIWDLG